MPELPTVEEAGKLKGFEASSWFGLLAPAGTPPDVVARLQGELARILRMPDIQAKLKGLVGEPGNLTPDQFAQYNRKEFERFGELIKRANIKLE
jgi:tripartite-type tricarboxylate transporter receptor subunit TctC